MKKTLSFLSAVSVLTLSSAASFAAPEWAIVPESSHLTFETTQSGSPIKGEFQKFTPTITFDKSDLAGSHIKVEIDTGSVKTGDKSNDASLPSKDWFNVKAFPTATFESVTIISKSADKDGVESYEATGKLTILGVTHNVTLPFTLKAEDANTHAVGSLALKRLDYGMGAMIDPNGAMVSNDVTVKFDIIARPVAVTAPRTAPATTTTPDTPTPKQ